MRIKLIVNPASGGRRAKKYLPRIRKFLSETSLLDISVTDNIYLIKEIASEAACRKNYDLLIAGGGDGTLNLVINAIKSASSSPEKAQDIPLGFIPLGISNVFALEVGIPQDPLEACKVILKANVKKLDIGKITMGNKACYFISMAGIGFDAEVVQRVNSKLKNLLGVGAYIIRGVYDFVKYNPPPFYIQRDNGSLEKSFLAIICNAKHYGGRFTITPEAEITDGYLDICLLKNHRRRKLLPFIFGVVTNHPHLKSKNTTRFKAKKIRIHPSTEKSLPIQIDGDPGGSLPAEFEVYPHALNMILPD